MIESWVQPVRHQLKSLIAKAGVDVKRMCNVPFGVSWEHDTRGLLRRTSRKLTLLDVGANVGQTARSLAEVFPNSKIYSFEPVPTTFAELQHRTARLPQVECIRMALGDEPGEAAMTSDRGQLNTILPGVMSEGSVQVEMGTIDTFCAERGIKRIDLLKMDTEGFEKFVLKGATQMLANGNIDFIVAECDFFRRDDQPHGDFFELYHTLVPLGYTLVSLYTGGVDQRGFVFGNMLMMRERIVDGLQLTFSPNWR
jgi:FkbM family methyltransferase